MTKTHYLSLDPGDTTGWASFDDKGNLIASDVVVGAPSFYELLDTHHPVEVFIEDYKLQPWKAMEQSWSTLDTVRLIGACEYWCFQHRVKLTYVNPRDKPIAYRYAGIAQAKNHKFSHDRDAYAHGVKVLQDRGIRYPQQGKAVH